MAYYYSNEIVFRGHPDKVCDQISDALLDAFMDGDKRSRCGIEVVGGKGKIFVTGEVSSAATVDVEAIIKNVLSDVGYRTDYEIINNIGVQSPDIAQGVDVGGAGDQGMMFGYACRDTEQLLPTAMVILQRFAQFYDKLRQEDKRFLPDGKAQITGCYSNQHDLITIQDFTVSYQNTEEERESTDEIIRNYITELCAEYNIEVENFHINPTGKFMIGGFDGDAGLTGRKIVVDNYHSFANVGGGAFSGKDPTKVDRSAAYMARLVARTILEQGEFKWCEVQLSYAIGMEKPLGIYIKTDKCTLRAADELYEMCKPRNIIDTLDLLNVRYYDTAMFGHFGDKRFTWER